MAPDIALTRCRQLPPSAVILDPMAGSGTVLRAAIDAGLQGIGLDVDPLSVLMSRVWTVPIDTAKLRDAARAVVDRAKSMNPRVSLPWIDEDGETLAFVNYWFGSQQQPDLRRLGLLLSEMDGSIGDALRVALSRLIITKDRGASLARDVSHSRPHRVSLTNDFEVIPAFLRSVDTITPRLPGSTTAGASSVTIGDARRMDGIADAVIDAIVTSPPYLNAIDYLRGHRLSLVWLGYRLAELRAIRADGIGAERMLDRAARADLFHNLMPTFGQIHLLPTRVRGMVERYLCDLLALWSELRRVLKPNGTATLVVGNSRLHGVLLDNAAAVTAAASTVGLSLLERTERELPAARRYLPPPQASTTGSEPHRMRTEVVLTFQG
jgi:hypothetical protein